jgi:putative N6-adenine-specific DNA methylase
MVKALAFTDKGLEGVLSIEVKEQTGSDCSIEDSCVIFEATSIEDLFRLIYFSQGADRIIVLLLRIAFSDFEDLLKQARKSFTASVLNEWLQDGSSFKFECERRGVHGFNSTALEQELGGLIIDKCIEEFGFEPKVDLKTPSIQFFAFVNNEIAYLGVDLCGQDLSKREYRIFTSRGMVNAKLAYAMVRLSGYSRDKCLVDLYSKAGIVAIEAALFINRISPNKYNKSFAFTKVPKFKDVDFEGLLNKFDSAKSFEQLSITGFDPLLRNLEAAKKNAKLAGVDKMIKFSRMDLEWVDSKVGESEVDLVISRIPCPGSSLTEKQALKADKELFHQSEFFLKSGARLCVLSESLQLLKAMLTPEFKIASEIALWAGKQEYECLVLERIKK